MATDLQADEDGATATPRRPTVREQVQGMVPRFLTPTPLPHERTNPDPPPAGTPATATATDEDPTGLVAADHGESDATHDGPGRWRELVTPPGTSSRTSTPDVSDELGELLTKAIGIVVEAAGGAIRRLRGGERLAPGLWTPTESERDDIAEPLARIGQRHAPVKLSPDLADGLTAAIAAASYGQTNLRLEREAHPEGVGGDVDQPTPDHLAGEQQP